MSKQDCIKEYDSQGYRILEIPFDSKNPKALTRKGWKTEPTNLNIGEKNLFAVPQDDNKVVLDIDDSELNFILESYYDKTLVVKTGNNGTHAYFKDITRVKPIKTTNLYKDGKHIGEIRTNGDYVIGCGSSYQEDNKTKTYSQISKTNKVLEIDFEEILIILKENGIVTKKENKTKTKFQDGLTEGDRNNECFKTACNLFEHQGLDFDSGLAFMKTWNGMSANPLSDSEVETVVKSAWNRIETKDKDEIPKRKEVDIYTVADQLMAEYTFITLEKSKEILFYKDGIYQDDGDNIISKRTRKIQDNIKLNHINEIKGIIKDETGYVSHDEFDKEEYKVNLKNCIFNFKTGESMDHTPDYLSRVKIPVFYNPDAKCPRFDKFLETTLISYETDSKGNKIEVVDEQKIRTILEMMALCMIKDNSLVQKAFMNTGKGSNGKSVLFSILVTLLGKLNVSAKTIHDFEKNHFASSSLEGKLANICADVGNKGIDSTEALKKLIGGDPVDCERKFMEGYTFTPYATLIFSANDIPEVSDESDGFARRFELIEWEKSFYGKDRDNSVKTIRKDPEELSGIFNKLSVIAKELLQTHALRYESTVEDAKIKWLKKSDSTQRFLKEMCSINPEFSCPVAEIFGNYTKFAKGLGMTPLNDRKFNAKLESQPLSRTTKRINGVSMKVWAGVTLSSKLAEAKGSETIV
jgi:P4 family phage/plasmid primase-like protien